MKFNLFTIKTKLITVSFLLVIIPLVVVGFFSYNSSKSHLDDLGATNLKNTVEMTIEMIAALNEEVGKGTITFEAAQEKVKVALLGEKDAEGIRPINPNLDLGENGYTFVLDQNGIQLLHPMTEGSNVWEAEDSTGVKFVQEFINTSNKGGGVIYYDWPLPYSEQIEKKIAFVKKDPHWDWTIVASTYMLDFNQGANEVLNVIFITIAIALIIGFFASTFLANRIANPIKSVAEQMNQLALGDLTQEHIYLKSRDEVGQLATSMNKMQDGIKNIILNLSNASELITVQSEGFTQSAKEVREGGEQIAITMQELSSGAESQANSATTLTEAMEAFHIKVQNATHDGEEIMKTSEQVLFLTSEGSNLMGESVIQMEDIHSKVSVTVEKVRELEEQTNEISQLVLVIQNIAEQTNLLSLNAAIEAARAGEHGKGFAVVADEVRKLSDEVSRSVGKITDIVERISLGSEQVVDSLQTSYEEVEDGTEQIKIMGQTFTNINEAMTDMVGKIQNISANLADLSENSDEMNNAIEEVASVTEETSAGVEETAAAAQQTSSAMDEIANSAEELALLAEQLNHQVQHFKL